MPSGSTARPRPQQPMPRPQDAAAPTGSMPNARFLGEVASRSLPGDTVPMSDRAPSPRTLGRYRISGVLARGGMGLVYRGEDPESGEAVAVKTVLRFSA